MAEDMDPAIAGDDGVDEVELEAKCAAAKDACRGECCCECELIVDGDDMALCALAMGVASLVIGMFGFHGMHFLALPLGIGAMMMAKKALKKGTRWEKQATGGLICGVVGAAFWLVMLGLHAVGALLRWIF